MAVSIPQVVTEDRASGALVIDGSLKFDKSKSQYLTRTPSVAGNRKKSTISYWIKRTIPIANFSPTTASVFGVEGGSSWFDLSYYTVDEIQFVLNAGVGDQGMRTEASYRDFSNWYHICAVLDTDRTNDDGANSRMRVWVNGKETVQKATGNGQPAAGTVTFLNDSSRAHHIGRDGRTSSIRYGDNYLAQFYIVDGLVLGPDHFGYYDPLTNVWRPKKFTADGTTINDGRSWSGTSSITVNVANANGAGSLAAVFNGTMTANSSNAYGFTTGEMDWTWTPNTPIPFGSQVRVWTGWNGGTVYLNGTEEIVTTNNNAWTTLTNGRSGKITSIRFYGGSGGGWWAGVEVDGVVLVDSTTQNLDFGTNGCYLPLDGNSPIGEDQSGKGNNWTPVNFGGSNSIDRATGALPILNTLGGSVARAGVFGSEVSKNYTTTSNTAAGSGYEFDQTSGFNPSLSFVRGATYTFDYTDSSSHPLRFSSTDPDSSVTSYTDGTNTSVSNTVKITVPHNAPDTLYYYCTSHNSMNGRISVTTDTKKADPYAWKNVLALPLVGSSADVSDQINVGSTAKTANNNNGSATASSVASNFYNGSFYFDGDDTLRYDSLSHIGTGDFTVECWYYKTSHNTYERVVSTSTGTQTDMNLGFVLGRDASGETSFSCGGNSVGGPTISLNTWHHLAGVRDNGVLEFFVDGVSQGTVANTTDLTNTDQIYVSGNYNGSSEFLTGYIQDVRVYDGVAKYTSNFIPASSNPDILPDTPSGVGTKTQLTKITDGAVSFDGSGNYLSVPATDEFTFGTGDFTIETLIYHNILGASGNVIIDFRDASNNTDAGALWKTSGGEFGWYVDGANRVTGATVAAKKWYHVALVRNSGTTSLYVDGISVGSFSDAYNYATKSGRAHIGYLADGSGTLYLDGFISNFRVVKGTALYTSNFIPPTAPLTNVTNTKLLTCQNLTTGLPTIAQSDGGLPIYNTNDAGTSITSGTRTDSNSANIDIALPLNGSNGGTTFTDVSDVIRGSGSAGTVTRSGTVTSTAQSLYYGSSAFFDGTNDYLEIPFPAISSTETWTIEWYQYQVADMPNPCTLCGESGSSFFTFGTADGDKIGFNWRNSAWSNGNRFFSPTGQLSVPGGLLNRWVHIVYQRNSDYTISVFANGELLQTSTNTYQASLGSGSDTGATLRIGNNFGTYWFSGYLQDIRIYSGVAKYGSSSFTPPTAPILPSTVSPSIVNVRGNSAATNFNPFNTDINTVRGQETGYATFNPLVLINGGSSVFSDGNLSLRGGGTNGASIATINPTSGKYYFELDIQYVSGQTQGNMGAGIVNELNYGVGNPSGNSYPSTFCGFFTRTEINSVVNGSETGAQVTEPTVGYLWGFTIDYDSKNITFYLNGVEGNTVSFSAVTNPLLYFNWGNTDNTMVVNFGQKPFKFPPPDGFQPLTSSTVRPDTVVPRPDQYVSPFLYTGDGSSSRDLTLPLAADFLWIKKRSATNSHQLVDTVRGDNSVLHTNSTNRAKNPQTEFTGGGISSISGITATLSSGTSNNDNINSNSSTLVGYTWKAGGAPTATNNNTSGAMDANSVSIDGVLQSAYTPSGSPTIYPKKMSIGTKQGFSIVQYAGVGDGSTESIPHGLLEEPDFTIIKNLTSDSTEWAIYHRGGGAGATYRFANDHKESTSMFGGANPANGIITLKENSNRVNNPNYDYICYSWHNVPGLQRFGSFTGNGSQNFVSLDFRPAIVWVKRSVANSSPDTSTNNSAWTMMDSFRLSYNGLTPNHLYANQSIQEGYRGNASSTSTLIDMTLEPMSNGFYLNGPATETNSNTGSFIYCAWAEAPSFNLYGAQSNAR